MLHTAFQECIIFANIIVGFISHIAFVWKTYQMPDVTGFVWVRFEHTDSTATHLIAKHEGAYEACKNQRVNARRIPAFAKKGLGANQDLHMSLGKYFCYCGG